MLSYHKTTEDEKYLICEWKHDGEYAIYNHIPYEEMKKKSSGLANPQNHMYSFYDGGDFVGFINLQSGEKEVSLGIEANPEFCNQGYGQKMTLIAAGIAESLFPGKPLSLEVRTWNQRAIQCYKKAGFHIDGEAFQQTTGAGEGTFYRMIR